MDKLTNEQRLKKAEEIAKIHKEIKDCIFYIDALKSIDIYNELVIKGRKENNDKYNDNYLI